MILAQLNKAGVFPKPWWAVPLRGERWWRRGRSARPLFAAPPETSARGLRVPEPSDKKATEGLYRAAVSYERGSPVSSMRIAPIVMWPLFSEYRDTSLMRNSPPP